MQNSSKILVFMESKGTSTPSLISNKKVSLSAFAATAPVLDLALKRHNKATNKAIVQRIILPHGDLHAYRALIGWIKKSVNEGGLVQFRHLSKKPLENYVEIISVAKGLGIKCLANALRRRVHAILARAQHPNFTLDAADVSYAFKTLPASHWLCKEIAKAIATATERKTLHPNFIPRLNELYIQSPAFQQRAARYLSN